MPIPSAAEIKRLCREYGVFPSKGMGQHFLVDPRVAERIVEGVAPRPRERLVEIGAGFGALTAVLLERGVTVVAVERDRRLARALNDRFGDRPDLRLVVDDILRVDWAAFGAGPLVVVGNLPYMITSPLLERLVRHRARVSRAVVTIQREVAQRIAAAPGTKTFGALTCFVQADFLCDLIVEIAPKSFWPQPAVTSAVLRLTPRTPPLVTDAEREPFTAVVQACFQHRRKTLLNGLLNPALGLTRDRAVAAIREAGLDPSQRPETVPVPMFAALARLIRI
ncbi:MAG: ribosomal RNA small subunit methyltransferase A [Candidatus Omnitrophica bacterium]|nr:ribosomal RNA small subunit methyltransferase A [Candidatus Omnitrophota bacterium]